MVAYGTPLKKGQNRIYSVHAQEVECLNKVKEHKRYEFGMKVNVWTMSHEDGRWVLSPTR